jgi:uncharacterized repeat protein (TIGR02543 family)
MKKFFAFFVVVFVAALWVTACDVPVEAPPVAGPEAKYFAVTFETDGGSPAPEEQRVLEGAQVAEPGHMTKAGFVFDRWYEDAEFTIPWDFETGAVTDNITLFAKWLPAYTVTFVANDGSPSPAPQEVVAGGSVTQPDPMTKTGFGFGGWFLDAECTEEWDFANDTVDAAITLYAMWDANYHAVTFDIGETEVTVTPSEQNIAFNSKAVAPALSEKTGYKLDGWYTDAERTDAWDFNTDVVTADITLYLNLAPIQYTIIFDANDAVGNGGSMEPLTLAYDSEQSLPVCGFTDTRQFYAFLGWNTAAGGGVSYSDRESVLNLTDVDNEEITLYAQWAMSASLLQAYITSQSAANGTGSVHTNPTPVALSVELSEANWGVIHTAMADAGKYVNLNLSGCTRSAATSGGGLLADGVFNGATSYAGLNKIAELTMPDTVVEIAARSFYWRDYMMAYYLTTINLPSVQTIGESAFNSCRRLANLSLPEVEYIGKSAFGYCYALTEIFLPNATYIGNSAFSWCFDHMLEYGGGLQIVNLPKAEFIGEYAFSNTESLLTVEIPAASYIDTKAFYHCFTFYSGQKTIKLGTTPPALGSSMFYNLQTQTITILVPTDSFTAYDGAWLVSFKADANVNLVLDTYEPE